MSAHAALGIKMNRRGSHGLHRMGPTICGRPRFAKHSCDEGSKASLQPYIRTFAAATPLSLMECAGRVPIDSMHSKCVAPDGFGLPRLSLRVEI